MLDVLIQAHNEELNLPHTLQSIQGWVNRIFVVDSGSTDGTRRSPARFGANVVPKAWQGYAKQKNWCWIICRSNPRGFSFSTPMNAFHPR